MKRTIYMQDYYREYEIGDELESHIIPLPPVISGVDEGVRFRNMIGLRSWAYENVTHTEILIPNYAKVTPSFVQGLFGSETYILGDYSEGCAKRLAKFLSMYSIRRECDKGVTDSYAQILLQKDILKKITDMIAD